MMIMTSFRGFLLDLVDHVLAQKMCGIVAFIAFLYFFIVHFRWKFPISGDFQEMAGANF